MGIKSREIYEAPGAMVLITAHTELEHVTLERELGRFKRMTDQRWGELVYDGLWYSPLKNALETFVAKTQEHVTGEIRMVLHGGHIAVNGRRSAESLYDFNLATYDEGDSFDQSQRQGLRACPRPVVKDRRQAGPRPVIRELRPKPTFGPESASESGQNVDLGTRGRA